MLRRLSLMVLTILVLVAPLAATVRADSAPPPPAPFGKYLVYSMAGVYDPSIPPAEGDLAEWFHRQVMGRDDADLETEQAAADAYFTRTFGERYTPGSLTAFGVDPRNEYRAYFISGMKVPPEGFVVRDGGFQVTLADGDLVVYGDYNIKVTKIGGGPIPKPILIHYESVDWIHFHSDGSGFFRCRLRLTQGTDGEIVTARAGLEAAQETLRLSQERKEFGIAAVLDHVLAEQDLTRSRNDYITAVAEYDKAQYALLRATGARAESRPEPK